MTQRRYLQSIASVCGYSPPASASDTALINWARSKGMEPAGGWNLEAKLTKEVMARTLVQLRKLAPGKADFDAVRILECEGTFIPASAGYVTMHSFSRVINGDFALRSATGSGDDDEDGPPPSPTRPGYGHGDKNHVHTGPPGKAKGGKPR